MFTRKVKVPTETVGMSRFRTYAMQERGAVPRFDLIARAIAKAIMKRPMLAIVYLSITLPVLELIMWLFLQKKESNIGFFRNFAKYRES